MKEQIQKSKLQLEEEITKRIKKIHVKIQEILAIQKSNTIGKTGKTLQNQKCFKKLTNNLDKIDGLIFKLRQKIDQNSKHYNVRGNRLIKKVDLYNIETYEILNKEKEKYFENLIDFILMIESDLSRFRTRQK